MSRTRHSFLFAQNGCRIAQIAGDSWEFEHGYAIRQHFHREDQLLSASQKAMTVETNEGVWVVPPDARRMDTGGDRAWGQHVGPVFHANALFPARIIERTSPALPGRKHLLALRELILHACQPCTLRRRVAPERKVIELILDQLRLVDSVPVQLPEAHDSRASKLANLLRANPHEPRQLATLSIECGASKRTMQRQFADECGMSFSRWRQRTRLIHRMQRLAEGQSVINAALDAGYSTTSAFISLFSKATRYHANSRSRFGRLASALTASN